MHLKVTRKIILIVSAILWVTAWARTQDINHNWPQWRGPSGDGVSPEKGLPVNWSEDSGIKWKCVLPGPGNSTPAIWGDAIFLTSQKDQDLLVYRIEKKTGRIVWTRKVGEAGDQLKKFAPHGDYCLATPSLVTNGEVVIAHFGTGDLAAFDFNGNRLWERNLQADNGRYTTKFGHSNSPVIYRDKVISICIQDNLVESQPDHLSQSYVIAHDIKTGRVVWKSPRMPEVVGEPCDSYVTPAIRTIKGMTELVVIGARVLDAYDPDNGKRLWYLPGLSGSRVIPTPVFRDDWIYANTGYINDPELLAIKVGGMGRRPKEDIIWMNREKVSDSPSPVIRGDYLFSLDNRGFMQCLNRFDGTLMWSGRVDGNYRASPIISEGRIYVLNMQGETVVVEASGTFKILAKNKLDDKTISSPTASEGMIFIRGDRYLYCIAGN